MSADRDAVLGFIEVVEAADLRDIHVGRPVKFTVPAGPVHGVLRAICHTIEGDVDLAVSGSMYTVSPTTLVQVITTTAAEVYTSEIAAAQGLQSITITEEDNPS